MRRLSAVRRLARPERRGGGYWVISVVAHVFIIAGLAYVLMIPSHLRTWLERDRAAPKAVERIRFVSIPDLGETNPGRSGGDGRPEEPARPARPLAPPTEVPSGVPPTPSVPDSAPAGGSGPVIGGGGPTAGIRPSYRDPRLWAAPGPVAAAPKTPAERLDSALTSRIRAHRDSMAVAGVRKENETPAWVVEKGGRKYGLDRHKIYLGPISLPSALLALLPVNRQANPASYERERALSAMRADINYHAERAMREDEFREAVKRIRERKERERREAQAEAGPVIP